MVNNAWNLHAILRSAVRYESRKIDFNGDL